MPVDWDPLQGLIHLHITLSVLSLSSAPQRRPSLPRCAAVYAESGYDRSWTEAPHLQQRTEEVAFPPSFPHSRAISCLQSDKCCKSLDSGLKPGSRRVRGGNTPRRGHSPSKDTHTHNSVTPRGCLDSLINLLWFLETVKAPSRIKPYY